MQGARAAGRIISRRIICPVKCKRRNQELRKAPLICFNSINFR